MKWPYLVSSGFSYEGDPQISELRQPRRVRRKVSYAKHQLLLQLLCNHDRYSSETKCNVGCSSLEVAPVAAYGTEERADWSYAEQETSSADYSTASQEYQPLRSIRASGSAGGTLRFDLFPHGPKFCHGIGAP